MNLRIPRYIARRLAAAGLLAALTAAAGAAARHEADERVQLPAAVTPQRYRIEFTPDAAARRFTGHVDIDLEVREPTERIVLNAAELVVDQAALSGETRAPVVVYDDAHQTLSLVFGHRLRAGPAHLHLDYHGRIYEQTNGLFSLDYDAPAGRTRALFTQFENADARRFLPCWDEPARKAVFELAATVPADQMAVSNMPIERIDNLADGRQHVRFGATPRMSSYLLFFALGDFERIHRVVDGVDVGVVVKRGDTGQAGYALEAAAQILPYYNEYFGTAYPLPKLDFIAGPGQSQFFGAMENWGAIFHFERLLLVDPRVSTEADRQRIYQVIAHEMAHQWFGDLVTMAWWDGLWLNEGFATWMAHKATDHFKSGWRVWLQMQAAREDTMNEDARDGTHPIITPIGDVLQAAGAFDAITYNKGAAVIRTLESYVGEDAFAAGVRAYMAAHAYGNTVSDDLWQALERAGGGPRRPVTQVAHELTLQAGVPLVRELDARCSAGRTQARLVQERYLIDPDGGAARVWHVPVNLAVLGGGAATALVSGARPEEVQVGGCGPLVLNAGQAAYLRTAYAEPERAALAERYDQLAAEDQLGLLDDSASLALAGQAPMGAYLELTRHLPARPDPLVALAWVAHLRELDRLYGGLPGRAALRDWARGLLQPWFAQVGWSAQAGEPENQALLRGELIVALGRFGDATVQAEARRRFELFLEAPATLDAATRRSVLRVVAAGADAPTWERLQALARAARSQLERAELYGLLAAPQDEALVQRALALALGEEVPATLRPALLSAAAQEHADLALGFALDHWDRVRGWIEPSNWPRFVPRLAQQGIDPVLIVRLDAFAGQSIPEAARRDLRKAEARIRYSATVRQARLPDCDRWLAAARSEPMRVSAR